MKVQLGVTWLLQFGKCFSLNFLCWPVHESLDKLWSRRTTAKGELFITKSVYTYSEQQNNVQVTGGIKVTKFHDNFTEVWCNFHCNYLKLKTCLSQPEIMSATSVMIHTQRTFKIPAAFRILSSSGHGLHELIKYLGPLAALNTYLEEINPSLMLAVFISFYIPYFSEKGCNLSSCPKPGIWTSLCLYHFFPLPRPLHSTVRLNLFLTCIHISPYDCPCSLFSYITWVRVI